MKPTKEMIEAGGKVGAYYGWPSSEAGTMAVAVYEAMEAVKVRQPMKYMGWGRYDTLKDIDDRLTGLEGTP